MLDLRAEIGLHCVQESARVDLPQEDLVAVVGCQELTVVTESGMLARARVCPLYYELWR
jgi:hypothetical protein